MNRPAKHVDKTTTAPTIILVTPQLSENIGSVARAMANFGLFDLRLVTPLCPWPSRAAYSTAAGGDEILDNALVFKTVKEAIAPFSYIYATTARHRDLVKPVITPDIAAISMHNIIAQGQKPAILFGGERTGLENHDLAFAQAIINIPTNSGFWSLNLAQSVLLIGYEWHISTAVPQSKPALHIGNSKPATMAEISDLRDHLIRQLDEVNFLRPLEKRASMIDNITCLIQRTNATAQEIRTLRGIIRALTGKKPPRLLN